MSKHLSTSPMQMGVIQIFAWRKGRALGEMVCLPQRRCASVRPLGGVGLSRSWLRQEQAEAHDLLSQSLLQTSPSSLRAKLTMGMTSIFSPVLLHLPGLLPVLITQSVA